MCNLLNGVCFGCLPPSASIDLHPVVLAVFNFASVPQSLCEDVAQVVIVRCLFEAEVAAVVKVLPEFIWVPITEVFDGGQLFLLADLLVLLFVRCSLQSLPW